MPRCSVAERFWAKVDKSDDCWLWTAAHNGLGYGRFWSGVRVVYAHRFAYELECGPIPVGLELDHLCRVSACVKPVHLEPVTHAENLARAGRLKTHCPRGHEYTPENTYRYSASRYCRTCNRAAANRRYQRRKEVARV